jgi:DHA3 family macrolide efflux protein-like MFS transporter
MSSLMWLTTPVGLWIAGPVSDHFGIQIWYLIAGLLTIFTILTSVLIPQLRDIEDSHVNVSVKEQIAVD